VLPGWHLSGLFYQFFPISIWLDFGAGFRFNKKITSFIKKIPLPGSERFLLLINQRLMVINA
jgi:hypothetical protein